MGLKLDYFFKQALREKNKPTLTIVCPYETYSINSLYECEKMGLINIILVGEIKKINQAIKEANVKFKSCQIIDANNDQEAANIAMQLLKDNKANMLMKGLIDTSILLKTLLKPEYDLKKRKVLSHCSVAFNQNYDRFYIITDPAMLIKPTLEQKKAMIENAVDLARSLGIDEPYVANLCAKEKVYEKMPDTIDAQHLKEMNEKNEIKDCIVSGPLQIDLAIDPESANIKGCKDPVAGKANILVCPNIEAANIFSKGIVYLGGWSFAGVILGAKIPIVLTSRSTNGRDRMLSIAIACAYSNYWGEKNENRNS